MKRRMRIGLGISKAALFTLACLVILFQFGSYSPVNAIGLPVPAPLPSGTQFFSYLRVAAPVVSLSPGYSKPLGIMEAGDTISLRLGLQRFTGPTDIYFAAYAPAIDPDNYFILKPDGTVQPSSLGIVPYKKDQSAGIDEIVFDGIQTGSLPAGRYLFYVAVTPAGRQDVFYLWKTSYLVAGPSSVKASASLRAATSCEVFEDDLKEQAIKEMEQAIDRLIANIEQTGYACWYYSDFSLGFSPGGGGIPLAPPTTPVAAEYSKTNVQVAGVDEADFVKNDGSYIYILSGGSFNIISAWPPQESRIISSTPVEGIPTKLFVDSGHAVVYSGLDYIEMTGIYNSFWMSAPQQLFSDLPECTYGYDCDFVGDGKKLKITVFDISDASNPKIEREMWLSGSYINSRRIGTGVHTVALFPLPTFEVSYWPDIMNECWKYTADEIIASLKELQEENRQIIGDMQIRDKLPRIKDVRHSEGSAVISENILEGCPNFLVPERPDGMSFLTILSFDLDRNEDANTTTVTGRPGAVYASPSSLYIAERHQYDPSIQWFLPITDNTVQEATTIHQFVLGANPTSSAYTGSGAVKGKVLNQFSMDEFDGHFRIATTTGFLPDLYSTVSVLKGNGSELSVVGQIDNIASGEDIRSARFDGERAFLVTFKKTDPLFALDLSSHTAPMIAGELKIPGFSTYMQLMDYDHLLTIGYDAQDEDGFAWFQGIMLQIFDIRDMISPLLLHKEVIGTRGTTSDAATNHLAFNYFAPKGLLGIPAAICEGGSGNSYGNTLTFNGLLVYDAFVGQGFNLRGGISHPVPFSEQGNYMCYNWWTQSNSTVKRSIFMDDYVFSVAGDRIKAAHIDNLAVSVSDIMLPQ